MNKKILIIAGIVVVVCVAIVGIVFAVINANKTPATPGVENDPKTPVAEIDLNTKQYIKQLEQVKIKGTNDTVMITKQVKWEVPEHEPGVLVEFEIAIPYMLLVDGKTYSGTYLLNAADSSKDDGNPKYKFRVTNLTKDGDIQIVVEKK